MKKILPALFIFPFIMGCGDSTVKADFNAIRTKKIILVGDNDKEYLIKVKTDSTGQGVLYTEEVEK